MSRDEVSDEERRARMALACVVEPGDPQLGPLLERFSAAEVWAGLTRRSAVGAWARRAERVDVAAVVRHTARLGLRFLVPGDADWPPGLAALIDCEPVRELRGAPVGLWVRGEGSLAGLVERSVAMVGSRASTPYGERIAGDWGAGLAASGMTVVSGAAYGIDAAAHRGALAQGGPTVAVVAGGLETPYPRAHAGLLGSIARAGLVVSEMAPAEHPTRRRFLARNRLIAAMALGTVIVEAATRSGARNTVTWAQVCRRPVMAVPGPVTSATSVTPHRLIRDSEALLVTCVAEICEAVGPMGELAPPRPARARLLDSLPPTTLAVYEALPARGTRDAGDVALRAGVPLPSALAALAELAAQDLAEAASDGGWRLGTAQDRPARAKG